MIDTCVLSDWNFLRTIEPKVIDTDQYSTVHWPLLQFHHCPHHIYTYPQLVTNCKLHNYVCILLMLLPVAAGKFSSYSIPLQTDMSWTHPILPANIETLKYTPREIVTSFSNIDNTYTLTEIVDTTYKWCRFAMQMLTSATSAFTYYNFGRALPNKNTIADGHFLISILVILMTCHHITFATPSSSS